MNPVTIFGAMVIGTASLLSLGVLPILLGGLDEVGRLSKAGIGQAAMFELFGLALGSAAGGYWMGRGAMRLKTVAAGLALAVVNVATAHSGSGVIILLDRAVAGLLGGLLFGAANAIIVRSNNPDRLTGILVGASVAPQIGLAYLIPVVLIPKFGIEAGFYALAAGAMAAAAFAVTLVDRVAIHVASERTRISFSGPLMLFCIGTVLQSGGLGAAWTYIERVANQHGLSPSIVGLAFSSALAGQVAAAWLSAWVVPKIAKWPTLFSLVLAQTVFTAVAVQIALPTAFVVSVCVFASAAAAAQAFQMAEIVRLDVTRKAAVLILPMILFGNGLGPLLASFATTEVDVLGGCWVAVAMSAISLLLYVVCAAVSARRRLTSPVEAKATLGS
ncbi:hypothetical protein CWR43_11865 [Rhizobium sullae]|uniref:MFS transporter n=2 Tax=Rhizobium sullae TaxID=50338 RepID=A0A2N0DC01_RHISU|nr:hypothetical protein CWR43_11865 [Rhizobium sullae]